MIDIGQYINTLMEMTRTFKTFIPRDKPNGLIYFPCLYNCSKGFGIGIFLWHNNISLIST